MVARMDMEGRSSRELIQREGIWELISIFARLPLCACSYCCFRFCTAKRAPMDQSACAPPLPPGRSGATHRASDCSSLCALLSLFHILLLHVSAVVHLVLRLCQETLGRCKNNPNEHATCREGALQAYDENRAQGRAAPHVKSAVIVKERMGGTQYRKQ